MAMLAIYAIFRRVMGMKCSHGLAAVHPEYNAPERRFRQRSPLFLRKSLKKPYRKEKNAPKSLSSPSDF
jgi:hypothetical protein